MKEVCGQADREGKEREREREREREVGLTLNLGAIMVRRRMKASDGAFTVSLTVIIMSIIALIQVPDTRSSPLQRGSPSSSPSPLSRSLSSSSLSSSSSSSSSSSLASVLPLVSEAYHHMSYREIIVRLHALRYRYPHLVRLSNLQDEFGVPSPGSCGENDPCKAWFVTLTNWETMGVDWEEEFDFPYLEKIVDDSDNNATPAADKNSQSQAYKKNSTFEGYNHSHHNQTRRRRTAEWAERPRVVRI